MARVQCRPAATSEQMLTSLCTQCIGCGQPMWVAYHIQRTITTLQGICLAEKPRLYRQFKEQGQVILAIDGLQPDVGHEVLWVLRDCLSGEVLLARSLLSACEAELASLLREVQQGVDAPIRGVDLVSYSPAGVLQQHSPPISAY